MRRCAKSPTAESHRRILTEDDPCGLEALTRHEQRVHPDRDEGVGPGVANQTTQLAAWKTNALADERRAVVDAELARERPTHAGAHKVVLDRHEHPTAVAAVELGRSELDRTCERRLEAGVNLDRTPLLHEHETGRRSGFSRSPHRLDQNHVGAELTQLARGPQVRIEHHPGTASAWAKSPDRSEDASLPLRAPEQHQVLSPETGVEVVRELYSVASAHRQYASRLLETRKLEPSLHGETGVGPSEGAVQVQASSVGDERHPRE